VQPRFFAPGQYATGDQIDLPDDEAQHLTRVLRLRPGDRVRVFDGGGREFDAAVAAVTKSGARVRVEHRRDPVAEAAIAITVAHAVLKGDKMDDVVRDAEMLGAAAIQPVVTARSESTLATLQRGHRTERWNRVALSSAKQCGRAVVPRVLTPIALAALEPALSGRDAAAEDPGGEARTVLRLPQPALMFVEPTADVTPLSLAGIDRVAPREATIVIGPEGGWTGEEIDRLSGVVRPLRLGTRTVRADAMAAVAIAALFAWWGEF
jgi:16S rRNA (uracil1498-N3)-methyltransferase